MPNPNATPNRYVSGVDYEVATQQADGAFITASGGGGASGPAVQFSQKRIDNTGIEYVFTQFTDGSSSNRRADTGATLTPANPTRTISVRFKEDIVQDFPNQALTAGAGVALSSIPVVTYTKVVLQPQGDDLRYRTDGVLPTAITGTNVGDGGTVIIDVTDVPTLRVFSLSGCVLNRQWINEIPVEV
jgi:hypothetical protein